MGDMPIPLHCHSHYSLLRGVGSPMQLAARAAELGYNALALTDRNALYGAPRFRRACRRHGLKPIYGAELTLETEQGDAHITLLAMDRTGYGNMCWLVSQARLACDKGEAQLLFESLVERSEGLICLSGPFLTAEIPRLLRAGRVEEAERTASRYREVFGDRFYLELQAHGLPGDRLLIEELAALGRRFRIPTVATTDVHYPAPEDRPLQDVVTAIRTGTTLSHSSPERLPNAQFYLRPPDELARAFRKYPEAIERTREIAERCEVELDYRDTRFPELHLPDGRSPDEELRQRCYEGAHLRYGGVPERVREQLDRELRIIAERQLAPFFLIAHDVARRFRGRCRGSAAGSLVVYCLGFAAVDPLEHGLLFERFVNPERDSPPDIDLDFSEAGREAAIRYCYETYGDHAAMVANYVRFRARSAVRDIGKVLGMPLPLVGQLAKSLDHHADVAEGIARFAHRKRGERHPWPLLARLCSEIDDAPRHLSVHVGGMLLTGRPVAGMYGVEPARKEGVIVAGADKEDIEESGLCKLDLLCLRSMSVVIECEQLERARGLHLDLDDIPLDDERVYEALGRADTIGASQVESRAQQQSLVRTRPRSFADIMCQVAIIRPGPIQGGAVHPYYRRRAGLEPVRYLHPRLEPILKSTLGVMLYQEQVLLAVSALTGCSPGEADIFRRAMGSHRSREAMEMLRPWFLRRSVANGIPKGVAVAAFKQIEGFGDYGFCQSHSAALARLAYETMWLRIYHPEAFYCALLNAQPMGFYPPEVLIWDGRRRGGVEFLPVGINLSSARCTLEGDEPKVRLGLARVKGVGMPAAERIVSEREASGPYTSLSEFSRRTGIAGRPLEHLVLAGAFDRMGGTREELLWEAFALTSGGRYELGLPEEAPELPSRSAHERTLLDYSVLGFSLDHHLVEHYHRRLRALRVTPSDRLERCPEGKMVAVGGLVVCRQRPQTAKGFLFLTLEDERGLLNIIASPRVYERYRDVLRDESLIAVAGRLQKNNGVANIVAERAVALDLGVPDPPSNGVSIEDFAESPIVSHDFR